MSYRLEDHILEAITNLKEPHGSNRGAIAAYIEVCCCLVAAIYLYFLKSSGSRNNSSFFNICRLSSQKI